ncbi:family 43 glycosylhydrolase [Saccharothrix sp. Mg75]|uniref:family 43 glycosylhydrolase n=1 Tax=Saccharothrix sp. Mg75 TaxID=3445357 RepID=UPI003EF008D0
MKVLLRTAGAVLVALVLVLGAGGTAGAGATTGTGAMASTGAAVPPLVIADEFPDPDVVQVDGTYYAYSTSSGHGRVPYATSASPRGPWSVRGDVLPDKPAWAGDGGFWAPDVSRRADGRFLLYFTAPGAAAGRMCLGAALADGPGGPFTAVSEQPLVCDAAEGGAIDPASFVDDDGTRYLLYKNDGNAIGKRSSIWLQRTGDDGVSFVGGRVALVHDLGAQDQGIVEAPVLVKRPSRYVLFFSVGAYNTPDYRTGYAVSDSLTGPYARAERPLMSTAGFDGAVVGPGGQDVGDGHVFFHGHVAGVGRGVYVADLGWDDDRPVVRGSRARYEAERGLVHRAVVRTGVAGASGGSVVSGIARAGSEVAVRVFAPGDGEYAVSIGYAAAHGDARHALSVNGAPASVVGYRESDAWAEAVVDVVLTAGVNEVRLRYLDGAVEVDYLDVA